MQRGRPDRDHVEGVSQMALHTANHGMPDGGAKASSWGYGRSTERAVRVGEQGNRQPMSASHGERHLGGRAGALSTEGLSPTPEDGVLVVLIPRHREHCLCVSGQNVRVSEIVAKSLSASGCIRGPPMKWVKLTPASHTTW